MKDNFKGIKIFAAAFFLTTLLVFTIFILLLTLYRMETRTADEGYTLLKIAHSDEKTAVTVHNKEYVFARSSEFQQFYRDVNLCLPISIRCYFDGMALFKRSLREIIENI